MFHSLAETFRTGATPPLVTGTVPGEDEDMFSVHCPRHGSEVLLSESRIRAIDMTGDGLTVRWECWCGHVGAHRAGRARRAIETI
jgi:hypothetical protein